MKPFSEFNKCKKTKDGYKYECRDCQKKEYALHREAWLIKKNEYYQNNIARFAEYHKRKYSLEKEKLKLKSRNYYHQNKEKIAPKLKAYRARPEIKARRREHRANVLMKDPNFVLSMRLRGRLKKVLKQQSVRKTNSFIHLLGCSLDELKVYIQSLFTEGMTWDKLLSGEIHIDHIIPCCAFDFSNVEEQKKCFHYTNLQPLWKSENCSKAAQDKKFS